MDKNKLFRQYEANKELMWRNVIKPTDKMNMLMESIDTYIHQLCEQDLKGQVDPITFQACETLNEQFINEIIRVGALRENADRREKLNHQAYEDVVRCLEPRWPDDSQYMALYRSWRPLQKFPGDDDVMTDDDRLI